MIRRLLIILITLILVEITSTFYGFDINLSTVVLSAQNTINDTLKSTDATQEDVYANDDYMGLDENSSETISLISNDLGLDEGLRSFSIVEYPEHGVVEVLPDYSVTYTPEANFHGNDIFKYRVCNTDGSCDEADVDITVFNVDYQPHAINDTIYVDYITEVSVDVLANDNGINDEPLTLEIVDFSENHSDSKVSENKIVYIPSRGFWGKDTLLYRVCDDEGDCATGHLIAYVSEAKIHDYFIPEAFSPNGDGINDLFLIPEIRNLENIGLTVFNSWGDIVFQTDNYENNWDGYANTGLYKGKKVNPGTYYYMIKLEGAKEKLTGFVYITY